MGRARYHPPPTPPPALDASLSIGAIYDSLYILEVDLIQSSDFSPATLEGIALDLHNDCVDPEKIVDALELLATLSSMGSTGSMREAYHRNVVEQARGRKETFECLMKNRALLRSLSFSFHIVPVIYLLSFISVHRFIYCYDTKCSSLTSTTSSC